MPKSKGRKKKSSTRRPVNAFGSTYWDRLLTKWAQSRLVGTAEEVALGGALVLWAGGGNPARSWAGMRQCWPACYFIGEALSALGGFKPVIVPVSVEVRKNGAVVETIGSPTPEHRGQYWTGHVALHIPEIAAILDPTIGQGRFATSDHLRVPVLIQDPQLTNQLPPSAQFQVNRDPQTTLIYTTTAGAGEPFETHPAYPQQRASVDAAVARVHGTVEAAVEEWRAIQAGAGR